MDVRYGARAPLLSVPLYMTHTHTHRYIYIYTYVRTHTHTHIYIYIPVYVCTFLACLPEVSWFARFADQDYIAETKLYYDTVLGKLRRAGDLFMPGRSTWSDQL